MNRTIAERPLAYYQTAKGEKLRVSEVLPTAHNQPHTELVAEGMWRVLRRGWAARFEPTILSTYEVGQVIGTPGQQAEKIQRARGAARYFMTALGDEPVGRADEVRAMLRVEAYKPRRPRPGNWLRAPYPNITDLETRNGQLADGPYAADAIALASVALQDVRPGRKVSAYTEAANPDGIRFYEMIGLHLANYVDHQVGSRSMADGVCRPTHLPYAHMEAADVLPVQQALEVVSQPFVPEV